jgi:hypothetical protein
MNVAFKVHADSILHYIPGIVGSFQDGISLTSINLSNFLKGTPFKYSESEDQGGDWRVILRWIMRGGLFEWGLDGIGLESCSLVDFGINGAEPSFLAYHSAY